MSLDLLEIPRMRDAIIEALRKVPAAPEADAPEQRVVLCGVNWEQYEAIDKALGHERAGPRLYYLDEELEIMTTSLRHERLKKWLADLLADYFYESGVELFTHGQATMKARLKQAGAEPDESWCFGAEKEFPDVVLEIALTSGGVRKLEVYQRFAVPEVWSWRKEAIEVWTLRPDLTGYDGPAKRSGLLPELNFGLLLRCLEQPTWREARRAYRAELGKI